MNILMKALVGSRLYGFNDENSDFDYVNIFVENKDVIFGLNKQDTFVIRPQPNGISKLPNDIEETFYPLKKFCNLLLIGNPNIIELLYLKNYEIKDPLFDELIHCRHLFLNINLFKSLCGYNENLLKNMEKKYKAKDAVYFYKNYLVAKHCKDKKRKKLNFSKIDIEILKDLKCEKSTLENKIAKQMLYDMEQFIPKKDSFEFSKTFLDDYLERVYKQIYC